jgi:hypothetical protein
VSTIQGLRFDVTFGDPPADPAGLERALPIVARASELWLLSQTPHTIVSMLKSLRVVAERSMRLISLTSDLRA